MQPLMDVGGHGDVHHLRVRQVEARHQGRVFVGVANLESRMKRFSSPMVLTVSPFCRGRERPASPRGAASPLQALVLGAGIAVWKSVRPVPRMSSVSPVKTWSPKWKL